MPLSSILLTGIIFLVAVVFSMLGQGGGTLYTPLQVLFGLDFHVAATTSLFLIMITSLSATLVFRKAKKVDWPLAIGDCSGKCDYRWRIYRRPEFRKYQ